MKRFRFCHTVSDKGEGFCAEFIHETEHAVSAGDIVVGELAAIALQMHNKPATKLPSLFHLAHDHKEVDVDTGAILGQLPG